MTCSAARGCRRLVVGGALLIAMALLAVWLQSAIEDVCIVPAINLLRRSGLFLRAVPQWVYWSLLVAGVALVALGSLVTEGNAGRLHLWRPAKKKQAAVPGPIGKLARYIHNTRRGPYFKWLVAHRLGELAQAIAASAGDRRDMQACRAAQGCRSRLSRSASGADGGGEQHRLKGRDWDAQCPAEVQAYLEAGLDRPPANRPRNMRGWSRLRFLSRRRPTPLNLDPSRVIEYLESQMETKA